MNKKMFMSFLKSCENDELMKYTGDNFRSMHAHIIYKNGALLFYSYATLVAARYRDKFYFKDRHYSSTTTRQITAWSGIDVKSRRDGVKAGIYGKF